VADTRRNFATFGVPEKLGFEGFDGEHPFCGTGMFTFLGQRLWGVPCTLAIDGSGTAAYIQAIDFDCWAR
jgi:hypothetical protein